MVNKTTEGYKVISLFMLVFLPFLAWGQITADTIRARKLLLRADSLMEENELLTAVANVEASINIFERYPTACSQEIAQCFYKIGEYYYRGRRLTEAADALDTALILLKTAYDSSHPEVAKCTQALGMVSLRQKKYTEGEYLLKAALNMLEAKKGLGENYRAKCYNGLGILYSQVGRYDEAILNYKQELAIHLTQPRVNPTSTSIIYNNIGNTFRRKGELTEAVVMYDSSLQVLKENFPPDHISFALPYHNLGNTYQNMGKYDLAIQYLTKSIDVRNIQAGPPSPDIEVTYSLLGFCYQNLGDIQSAIIFLEKALEVNRKYKGSNDPSLASSLINLGMLYGSLERIEEASDRATEGRRILLRYLSENSPTPASASLFDQLGFIHFSIGNIQEAITDWERALQDWKSLPQVSQLDLANAYGNLGIGYSKVGAFEWAIEHLKENLKINTLSSTPAKVYRAGSFAQVLGVSEYLAKSRLGLYRSTGEVFHLRKGYTSLTDAISLLEEKAQFSNEYSTEYLARTAHKLLSEAADVWYYLAEATDSSHYLREIVELVDRANSFFFFRTKKTYAELARARMDHPLFGREEELTVRLTKLDVSRAEARKEGTAPYDPSITAIDNLYFLTKDSLIELREKILSDLPTFQLQSLPPAITLENIEARLKGAESSLLTYLLTDSSLFILHISEKGLTVNRVARDFELAQLLRNFKVGLLGDHIALDTETYEQHQQKYLQSAAALYQKLVAPVASELSQNLIIVPDPQFGDLPFELLLSAPVKKPHDYSSYPYLLKAHRISYAVSISAFCEMPDDSDTVFSKNILALAPFSKKGFISDTPSLPDQEILRGTGDNVKVIAEIWNGDFLVDDQATEEVFVTIADEYRILHIASHGVVDRGAGELSGLLFSSIQDSIENEVLYTKEIYNLRLNTALVTLSGCETSLGRFQWGEGFISLNRAFSLAGARSVVSSLWPVRNDTSNELMKTFYERLAAGEDRAEALYNAKMTCLNRPGFRSHPFFWGAFVLTGDRGPIAD